MAKTDKRAQILYASISIAAILVSLIFGIIFNSYEASVVLLSSSLFCYFALLINLYSMKSKETNNLFMVLSISFLRFILIAIGLIFGALFIYFNNMNESENSRYLYLLLGLVPIFFSNLIFFLRSKND